MNTENLAAPAYVCVRMCVCVCVWCGVSVSACMHVCVYI